MSHLIDFECFSLLLKDHILWSYLWSLQLLFRRVAAKIVALYIDNSAVKIWVCVLCENIRRNHKISCQNHGCFWSTMAVQGKEMSKKDDEK